MKTNLCFTLFRINLVTTNDYIYNIVMIIVSLLCVAFALWCYSKVLSLLVRVVKRVYKIVKERVNNV